MNTRYFYLLSPILVLVCFLVFQQAGACQSKNTWNVGMELDVLPYVTGGYFGAVWAGKGKWRVRSLLAQVNKPDFTTKRGFHNHTIRAYALVADRFLTTGWSGWWVGGGPVYWQSTIEGDTPGTKETFHNYLLNGSLGYHFMVYKNVYLSPWAGISLKIAGDHNIIVGDQIYNLQLLNPEMSLKGGIYF